MAGGISELALPSFTIPDLFLTKKLTVVRHGRALSLSPNLSTTPLGSPVTALKSMDPREEVGNEGLNQNQEHCHGQKAGSHSVLLIDRIEMLSLKEHSGDVVNSSSIQGLPIHEPSELDCSESTVAALSDYGDDNGEGDECVLMRRFSEPTLREEGRKINPDIVSFV